jgi:hypothetical protein
MAVSRRLRFEILRRDSHTCRYCGAKAPDVALTVDHVIPITLGGGDDPSNLVTACQGCNAGKASIAPGSPLVDDVDAAAVLFARAVEQAIADRRSRLSQLDAELRDFERHIWNTWTFPDAGYRTPLELPADWRQTVERFMAAGLDLEDLERLTRVAMTSNAAVDQKWRYFCGCCWRTITDIQEDARRILEDESGHVGHPVDGEYL